MPTLGDYLGYLLSEITLARVQSDMESLRLAELYASHPLLRHLPVPHFRLPSLTVDVPVAVKQMENVKEGSPRGRVDRLAIRDEFKRLLASRLETEGIKIDEATKKQLDVTIDETLTKAELSRPTYFDINVKDMADELVAAVVTTLQKKIEGPSMKPERLQRIVEDLKAQSLVRFLDAREAPPRLFVLVTTSELREAGPPDLLPRISLTISEEALEWKVIESKGKSTDRLVPE